MNSRGVTLVEALVALAIIGLASASMLPAFMTQVGANGRSEERTGAITAVQMRLEALRLEDPDALPDTGSSAAQQITVGDRQYDVVTTYCSNPVYCSETSRHLLVEAFLDGRKIYDAETVYTQFL